METTRRSIAKTLSWRVLATAITTAVVYLATGRLEFAVALGAADTAVKLLVYFAHERLWNRIPFGRAQPEPEYFI